MAGAHGYRKTAAKAIATFSFVLFYLLLKLRELLCTQLLIFLVRHNSCGVLLCDETRLRHVNHIVAFATEISDLGLRFSCMLLLLGRLLLSIYFLLRCCTIMLRATVYLSG